jgi:hypothetical protein
MRFGLKRRATQSVACCKASVACCKEASVAGCDAAGCRNAARCMQPASLHHRVQSDRIGSGRGALSSIAIQSAPHA